MPADHHLAGRPRVRLRNTGDHRVPENIALGEQAPRLGHDPELLVDAAQVGLLQARVQLDAPQGGRRSKARARRRPRARRPARRACLRRSGGRGCVTRSPARAQEGISPRETRGSQLCSRRRIASSAQAAIAHAPPPAIMTAPRLVRLCPCDRSLHDVSWSEVSPPASYFVLAALLDGPLHRYAIAARAHALSGGDVRLTGAPCTERSSGSRGADWAGSSARRQSRDGFGATR